MQIQRFRFRGIVLIALTVILFLANLAFGSVSIPLEKILSVLVGNSIDQSSWQHIILESRLPQAVTAVLTGAALAICGLLLQTLFQNPLADPSILGISAGANLGVAAVVFFSGGTLVHLSGLGISGHLAIVGSAFIGAIAVLNVILYMARRLHSNLMLLIVGIMVSYLVSSLITFINFYSSAENAFLFMLWGMGDFSGVTASQLPTYAILIFIGLGAAILQVKPLNALLMGERYAINLGVRIKQTRLILLIIAGLLTAVTTAFCGPISFIGLAVPHIARLILGTGNHKKLLPFSLLLGGAVALLCNLLTNLPGHAGIAPLNAITPILGAPVVLYVLLARKRIIN
ncbi:MAG: iron ABC transporter permease [Bacteroidales bacterium]|nr:iron ABC transporter permease [Bacteroidales bacterium]